MKFHVHDSRREVRGRRNGKVIVVGEVKAYRSDELGVGDFFSRYVLSNGTEVEADDRRDAVDRYLQVLTVIKRIEE